MNDDHTIDNETFEREEALNREAWEKLRDQIRREHAGKYVALVHGKIVAASTDFDEALAAAHKVAPVPNCFLVWLADEDPIFEPYDSFQTPAYMPIDDETEQREMAMNRQAWDKLRDQVRREHAGKYVALVHGQIVAAATDFDEALAAAHKVAPVPNCFLVWPADEEPPFEPYYSY